MRWGAETELETRTLPGDKSSIINEEGIMFPRYSVEAQFLEKMSVVYGVEGLENI